jgi:Zinc finger, C3HC4 type (RING finger)
VALLVEKYSIEGRLQMADVCYNLCDLSEKIIACIYHPATVIVAMIIVVLSVAFDLFSYSIACLGALLTGRIQSSLVRAAIIYKHHGISWKSLVTCFKSDIDTMVHVYQHRHNPDGVPVFELKTADEPQKHAVAEPPSDLQWLDVLRPVEPVKPGEPSCVCCEANRASILYADCGHQVMCDDCHRQLRCDVNKSVACIICRAPCTRIIRPILAEAFGKPD